MPKQLIDFPAMTWQGWQEHMTKETSGSHDPVRSWEGISLQKFYPFEEIDSRKSLFGLTGNVDNGTHDARRWQNVVQIADKKAGNANSNALNALILGADGILFKSMDAEHAPIVLQDILPEFASISFRDISWDFVTAYRSWLDEHDLTPEKVSGYIQLAGEDHDKDLWRLFKIYPSVKCFHFHLDLPETGQWIQQIADLLEKVTDTFDKLLTQGVDKAGIWNRISLSIEMGPLFFEEIARLKAIRLLLYKIARAFEVHTAQPQDLLIHAQSTAWLVDDYQPHGNIIKGTTTCLAGILGDAGMITVECEEADKYLSTRIARNIGLILREESFLKAVSNPVAGSYYIERFTEDLSRKSWERFTGKKSEE